MTHEDLLSIKKTPTSTNELRTFLHNDVIHFLTLFWFLMADEFCSVTHVLPVAV